MEHDTSPKLSKMQKVKLFFENILYIAVAIILASLIQAFLVRPFIVSGASMDPVIKNKEYLLIDEATYRVHLPERGDVIVFKAPPEPTKFYIKRIIGLPGEMVRITGKTVTIINAEHPEGFTLNEPYVTHTSSNFMEVKVPADHYFVLGDNRSGSYDSREWGTLPKENIRGRTLVRLLPLQKMDYMPGKEVYGEQN